MTGKGKFSNKWESTKAIFIIWIGSNDIIHIKNNRQLIKKINSIQFDIIEKLYNLGARNFIIFTLSPVDRAPYNLNGKINYLKNEVAYFNDLIKLNSKNLYEKLPGLNIFIYDIYQRFYEIINNCKKFNFKDCVNPWDMNKENSIKKYFWKDWTHTTWKTNKLIAKDLNNILKYASQNIKKSN